MSALDNFVRDRRDLFRGFAETQHDFWKALPDGPMVIDLGKPKILKGLLAKRGQKLRRALSPCRTRPSRTSIEQRRSSASVIAVSSVFR